MLCEFCLQVGNKTGYAPKTFLKELKVLIPDQKLVTVTNNVAPEPVKVETTQNDSLDVTMKKTKEIPAVSGSLLSFPSMASAESVDGQQAAIPKPSSPQYEVVDGTTLWMDPVMPMQETAAPNTSEKKEVTPTEGKSINDNPSEVLQNSVPQLDTSASSASETSTNSLAADLSANTEKPVAGEAVTHPPVSVENFITPVPVGDDNLYPPQQSSDMSTEASQESVVDVTTLAPPEATSEAIEEREDSQEIEPTKSGIISNLWNTMFNSGDGTEENSQENEEEEEDGDEEEEGDEDGEDGTDSGEEEPGRNLNEPDPKQTDAVNGQDSPASDPTSTDGKQSLNNAENAENVVTPSPLDLLSSFPQVNVHDLNEKVRSARQVDTLSGEAGSEGVMKEKCSVYKTCVLITSVY